MSNYALNLSDYGYLMSMYAFSDTLLTQSKKRFYCLSAGVSKSTFKSRFSRVLAAYDVIYAGLCFKQRLLMTPRRWR